MPAAPGTLPTTWFAAACTTGFTLPAVLLMCAMPARAAAALATGSAACGCAGAARPGRAAGGLGGGVGGALGVGRADGGLGDGAGGGFRLCLPPVELGLVGGGLHL